MDIKRKKEFVAKRKDNLYGLIGGAVLLAMYIAVSTMEYNDCLRGAMSC